MGGGGGSAYPEGRKYSLVRLLLGLLGVVDEPLCERAGPGLQVVVEVLVNAGEHVGHGRGGVGFERSVVKLLAALQQKRSQRVDGGDLLLGGQIPGVVGDAVHEAIEEAHVLAQMQEQHIGVVLRRAKVHEAVEESRSILERRLCA